MDLSVFLPLLIVMALTTYLVRALPFTLFRRRITNARVKAFFELIPYTVLSAMTFPAILYATGSPLVGGIAMAAGVLSAWFGANSFVCAVVCSGTVFVLGLLL